MYRVMECEEASLLGSTTEWLSVRALQTWAADHGMTVERVQSESDGTISYILSDEYGQIARVEQS